MFRLNPFPFLVLSILVGLATGARAGLRDASNSCDYLVITHQELRAQGQRLVDFRNGFPLDDVTSGCIADVADIYAEFPPEGEKYRSVLALLRHVDTGWAGKPDYVVLFGDASEHEAAPSNRVPTFVHRDEQQWRDSVSISVDDFYAFLLDSLPDWNDHVRLEPHFSLGRIPARDTSEARLFVDKVIRYENDFRYWPEAFTYGFVSDDDRKKSSPEPIFDLHHQIHSLREALPENPFQRHVLTLEYPLVGDTLRTGAGEDFLSLLGSGAGRIFFIGHGDAQTLTDEGLFNAPTDMRGLPAFAGSPAPILGLLACGTSSFILDTLDSMGESLLFHPHGPVAVLGAVEEVYPRPNLQLFQAWNTLSQAGGKSLGRSFYAAKFLATQSVFEARNHLRFAILGDPALTLRAPTLDLAPGPGTHYTRLAFSAPAGTDSIHWQLVTRDSVPYAPLVHPQSSDLLGLGAYERETKRMEWRAGVPAGGGVVIDIPDSLGGQVDAIKVMCWGNSGWHYGHIDRETMKNYVANIVARRASSTPERFSAFGPGGITFHALRDGKPARFSINGRPSPRLETSRPGLLK